MVFYNILPLAKSVKVNGSKVLLVQNILARKKNMDSEVSCDPNGN